MSRLQAIFSAALILMLSAAGCTGSAHAPSAGTPSSIGGLQGSSIPSASSTTGENLIKKEDAVPLKPLGAAGELASYYDRHLAIKDGTVYGWTGDAQPKAMLGHAVQVGVGDTTSYALLQDGRLVAWTEDPKAALAMTEDVVSFSAGRTGVFAVKKDGSLWRFDAPGKPGMETAKDVVYSSIGDGTDYYITKRGDLFARGLAHRGQYGNGSLESTPDFVKVASGVVQVRGHTGHALLLKSNGDVQGTGGNIYGPLGEHGLGDKATSWGTIFTGASLFATGSSHSAAVKQDGTLWIWGSKEGTAPRQVLENVVAVGAGRDATLAKTKDGSIWFWQVGKEPGKIL